MNTSNYAHRDRLKITKRKIKFTADFLEVNMFEKSTNYEESKAKMIKTAFACYFTWGYKFGGKYGIYHFYLLYFIPEYCYLLIFATNLSNTWTSHLVLNIVINSTCINLKLCPGKRLFSCEKGF